MGIGLRDTARGVGGYSDWSAHGPASESQAARPTPGVHSPSPALRRSWIARPLGPAPLRFGPPAARGKRAGLRGRPLIVASWTQGSWEGATAARAHDQDA